MVKNYQKRLEENEKKLINQNFLYNQLIDDYKLSLDNQIMLKTEIKVLKKLIEGEEKRLNISSTNKPIKRKSFVSLSHLESMFSIVSNHNADLNTLVFNDWNITSNFISIKNISKVFLNFLNYFFRNLLIYLNI